MEDRIKCCIPHCNRTIKRDPMDPPHTETICNKHWSMTSKYHRKLFLKHQTKYENTKSSHNMDAMREIWKQLKNEAMDGELFK